MGQLWVGKAFSLSDGVIIKVFAFKVLLKTQSTALGLPLDTERLAATSASLQILKEIRNSENRRYDAASRSLWIPDAPTCGDVATIRRSASREIFGFVTAAQFAYHAGGYVGVGFVTLAGLRQLRRSVTSLPEESGDGKSCWKPLVLVRETTSLQYRFARLAVG